MNPNQTSNSQQNSELKESTGLHLPIIKKVCIFWDFENCAIPKLAAKKLPKS